MSEQEAETAEGGLFCFNKEGGLIKINPDGSTCTAWEILYDILNGWCEIVKVPWEPKENDLVWYPSTSSKKVRGFPWTGSTFNLAIKVLGMVYRTREEAKAHFPDDYERLTGEKLEG